MNFKSRIAAVKFFVQALVEWFAFCGGLMVDIVRDRMREMAARDGKDGG